MLVVRLKAHPTDAQAGLNPGSLRVHIHVVCFYKVYGYKSKFFSDFNKGKQLL